MSAPKFDRDATKCPCQGRGTVETPRQTSLGPRRPTPLLCSLTGADVWYSFDGGTDRIACPYHGMVSIEATS